MFFSKSGTLQHLADWERIDSNPLVIVGIIIWTIISNRIADGPDKTPESMMTSTGAQRE